MRRFFILTIAATTLFLLAIIMLQAKLIFFPEKLPANYVFDLADSEEEVLMTTVDGKKISGLLNRTHLPEARGVILYLHGNAGSLRSWKDVAPTFTNLGFDILIIDYRGFGKSTGSPTEKGLYEDAHTAWRFLLTRGYQPGNIVLYGRSVGTGVASELATQVNARAMILESPFTSMVAVAKALYPFLLPGLILRFRFETDKRIDRIKMPVLIIHGDRDEIIPVDHSHKLHAQFKERSKLVIVAQAGHNDISAYPAYDKALQQFLTP